MMASGKSHRVEQAAPARQFAPARASIQIYGLNKRGREAGRRND